MPRGPGSRGRYIGEHGGRKAATSQGGRESRNRLARDPTTVSHWSRSPPRPTPVSRAPRDGHRPESRARPAPGSINSGPKEEPISPLPLSSRLKIRREKQVGRTFQVVFLTDGLPTVGTTDPKKIIEIVSREDSPGVRIYTFGVGDDVDTQLLDSLAETTRGSSTYVRPDENLESKVSAFTAKIQRPVRTDLELEVRGGPRIVEMYPPRIPDLFHGEQLQVVGRYEGHGTATLTLKGLAGESRFSESLETTFPRSRPSTISSLRSGPGEKSATCSTRFDATASRPRSSASSSGWPASIRSPLRSRVCSSSRSRKGLASGTRRSNVRADAQPLGGLQTPGFRRGHQRGHGSGWFADGRHRLDECRNGRNG